MVLDRSIWIPEVKFDKFHSLSIEMSPGWCLSILRSVFEIIWMDEIEFWWSFGLNYSDLLTINLIHWPSQHHPFSLEILKTNAYTVCWSIRERQYIPWLWFHRCQWMAVPKRIPSIWNCVNDWFVTLFVFHNDNRLILSTTAMILFGNSNTHHVPTSWINSQNATHVHASGWSHVASLVITLSPVISPATSRLTGCSTIC
jgi:hypothetical protein